jgi:putative PIG3 family NAD(P)H quinone oxidoreductase
MRAVVLDGFGGTEVLRVADVPDPVPGPGEVLLDVAATAVNRADLLQRQGFYPPPPGASEILGLECSGTVAAVGPGAFGWSVGDEACALLAGGGYATRVVVPVGQCLPVPSGVDVVTAAALPEAACTVWSNVVGVGCLTAGETLLVHGGASGIGTFAIQVAKRLGARVVVTARAAKHEACRALGADETIDYETEDFAELVRADLILDILGARYLARNVAALNADGRLVVIGLQGGTTGELDLGALMGKRAHVTATSLRYRPAEQKAAIVAEVHARVWPMIEAGDVRPVVDRVLALDDVAEAHRVVAASEHVGKVVLAVSR